jgi:hypothetical protein
MRFTSVIALASTASASMMDDMACMMPPRSTVGYSAALSPHGGACPTATNGAWSMANNAAGCCQSGSQIHSVGKLGAACCPCGAFCTGFFPDQLDWNEKGGENKLKLP